MLQQLLELGERIGNVSRGFSREDIKRIPKTTYEETEDKSGEKSMTF